ncbi:MAG TPA: ATP-binding protein, partial [Bacteroidia bacterium]|nr:ATP-binding protein [Bacteroidia bacterium]
VHTEWLFKRKLKAESLLFIRDKDKIEITKEFQEGKGIEERTRDNALFLSVVDQWNGDISKKIIGWFSGAVDVLSGLSHDDNKFLTIALDKSSNLKGYLNNIINQLDLGFKEFRVDRDNKENLSSVFTYHNKYDSIGNVIDSRWFDLSAEESSGTNKIFDLAGHISIGLLFNKVIFIDELDAKLHPLLTLGIVKLFNSPEYNVSNAQLIFATHDTNLLTYGEFRRDQIYFTEKNQFEETDLYSLVEFKDTNGVKTRNDRSFEKDYIKGRYGAIPFIGDFSNLLSNDQDSKD